MAGKDDIVFNAAIQLDEFISGAKAMNTALREIGQGANKAFQNVSAINAQWNASAKQFQSQTARIGSNLKDFVGRTELLDRVARQTRTELNLLGQGFESASRRAIRAGINYKRWEQNVTEAKEKAEQALKEFSRTSQRTADEEDQANQAAEDALREYVDAVQQAYLSELELKDAILQRAQAQAAQAGQTKSSGAQMIASFQSFRAAGVALVATVGKLATALGIVAGAGLVVRGVFSAVKKIFEELISPLTYAWNAFTKLFKTATAVAFGVLVRDTIRNIVRELKDLVVAANDAIKMFQVLQLRLESFENRLIRTVDPTLTFADAMGMASERAAGLVELIKNLSLTIPFDTEIIGSTLSLNLAMGFTERQAISLTKSIAAFTAGMGLSSEIMERIVFNLGQMKAAGKVTATELRDLARGAFFPLNDILAEAARLEGVAANGLIEFKKAAAEGKIDVQTFFQAFENVVARDFPDALERFSRTIEGVQIRFKNFMKTIVGLEVLGPIAKRVTGIVADALDRLLSPSVQRAAKLLGESLNRAFGVVVAKIRTQLMPALTDLWESFGFGKFSIESVIRFIAVRVTAFFLFISKGIQRLSDWIKSMADNNETILKNHAKNAFAWGYNIIVFLAKGMVEAASWVIKALTFIAGIITYFLKAHSPPKLLPDLPKWGMAAMASWLKGFTLVDFDVLTGIQDPVKDALDILEETGKIAADSAGRIYANISKEIAKALSTGAVTENLFKDIEKITGPFGKEIAELARRQVKLAAATKAVQEAEERLERARKAHEAARIKTNKLIREYNDELRKGASKEFLRNKLAEINVTEKSAQAAYQEQKAAEANLETKQTILERVEEQLKLQEALVKQLIELTRAQIVQPDALEDAKDAGEEAVEDLAQTWEDVFSNLPTVGDPAFTEDLNSILDEAMALAEQWGAQMDQFWEDIGIGDLETVFKDFQAAIDDLQKAWDKTTVFDAIAEDINTAKAALDAFKQTFQEIFGGGGTDYNRTKTRGKFRIPIETSTAGLGAQGGGAGIIAGISAALTGGFVSTLATISGILGAIDSTLSSIKSNLDLIYSGLKNVGLLGGPMHDPTQTQTAQDVQNLTVGILQLKEAVGHFTPGGVLEAGVSGFTDAFVGYFENMGVDVPDWFTRMMNSTDEILTGNYAKALFDTLGWTGSMVEFFEGLRNDVSGGEGGGAKTSGGIVPDMMTSAHATIAAGLLEMLGTSELNLTDIETLWGDKWEAIKTSFHDNFVTPVQEAIDGTLTTLDNFINNTLGKTLQWFNDSVLAPLSEGFAAVNGLLDAFAGLVEDAWAALQKIPQNIINWLIGHSPSPLALGISSINDAIQALAKQAVPQMEAATTASAPSVANNSNSINVNMGGVNINNGMDQAVFEARVLNIVNRALRI